MGFFRKDIESPERPRECPHEPSGEYLEEDTEDTEDSVDLSEGSESSYGHVKMVSTMLPPDKTRSEEPWSEAGEKLMNHWLREVYTLQYRHGRAGYFYKKMRKIWGLPCVIIPSVMTPITNVYADYKHIQYINMLAFVTVAIFTGVDSFFSFALRRERHFNHSTRYSELHSEIQVEMIKERRYRVQSDVFFTRIQMKYDMLNTNAPIIPNHINKIEIVYPYSKSLVS
jgi:hypothetical protein